MAPTNLIVLPRKRIRSGGPSAYAAGPPVLRYDIHTCPTVLRAQATRALSRRTRHEYRVSTHCRLTNLNLYAISANDHPIYLCITRWHAPHAPRESCVYVNHWPSRPEQAVISLFFRSLRRRRPRIPAEKGRPPLIIPCKNSKNSEGPFPEDPVRKDICVP